MKFTRWSKLQIHVLSNRWHDLFSSDRFCKKRSITRMDYSIEVTQPFTHSTTLEQKKHNLRLAADRIRNYIVMPGEVFSFWRCVGNTNTKAFVASRGIRGGVLQLERGGGLCQASGIIHHLALMGGLEIIERYNHSKDLYTEETRFCPLGSDATVAYGYRDLRLRNTLNTPILFDLQVHDDHFTAYLRTTKATQQHDIDFSYIEKEGNILEATTKDNTTGKTLAISTYERLSAN